MGSMASTVTERPFVRRTVMLRDRLGRPSRATLRSGPPAPAPRDPSDRPPPRSRPCHAPRRWRPGAMRHDTSSPRATASSTSRPLTPPSRSAAAKTEASTETSGWIEPPVSKVSSKSSAWPMLAFSTAACSAGRRVPRSSTRLSSRPRACSRKYRECRGARVGWCWRVGPYSRCGRRAGQAATRRHRSLIFFH
jgi:hypothetical protein